MAIVQLYECDDRCPCNESGIKFCGCCCDGCVNLFETDDGVECSECTCTECSCKPWVSESDPGISHLIPVEGIGHD